MNQMTSQDRLRGIPQIDALLREPSLAALAADSPHLATQAARDCVAALRAHLLADDTAAVDLAALCDAIVARAAVLARPAQCGVINATGVLLHTNLGRAPLGEQVAEQVKQAAMHYTTLEYDPATGTRGDRNASVAALLCAISGAEAALAVNNNAAAVLLLLTALAAGQEVIVSRGELVEIGGSFRVPEIMAQSGARLVEVGATNKTRAADYAAAIVEQHTAALLKVHASNFKMIGFTEETPLAELAALAHAHGLPLFYDAGSATVFPLTAYGIQGQLTLAEMVRTGADVICFSGDKLFGGPQAGLIIGKKQYIDRMKRHPLARALRPDKLTLTALAGTLQHCQSLDQARRHIPLWAMLSLTMEELQARGTVLLRLLHDAGCTNASLCETAAQTGGGSAPCETIASLALCILPRGGSADALERTLRTGNPPILARIAKGRVLFDLRTIQADELPAIVARLCETEVAP